MTGDPSGANEAVRAAEEAIRPALLDRLDRACRDDTDRADALSRWGSGAGDRDPEAVRARAAARQANVLTNHVRYRVEVGRAVPRALTVTPVTPFQGLGTPDPVEDALDDLERRLANRDEGAGRADRAGGAIGARYADVLPDDERRIRGQFYTPAAVADLVVRWALDGGADRPHVLDPAAGTGTFPLATYDVLRERNPDADARTLQERLVAVDVDAVALHLAALRLSARTARERDSSSGPPAGLDVERFDRRACSFFDLEPGRDVAPVDAVVGNPPFVRAGDLSPDREHFRAHLASFDVEPADPQGGSGVPGYDDGERALSRRSDASVYFVTHATRFLRPGGRLGVVLPAKWLESDYGVGFRRFLADQYRVHAVVGIGTRAFDALVDTVLLLAERRAEPVPIGAEPVAEDDATVRFVGLGRQSGTAESLSLLRRGSSGDGDDPVDGSTRPDRVRVVRTSQSTFADATQCSPYLRAPSELLPLLEHPSLVPLGDLASVSRGVTTGANRFFLLDPADRTRWDIDGRLCRPALRSVRGVEARTLGTADVEQAVLDVHGFLADRSGREGARTGDGDDGDGDTDPAERAKAALRDAGHDGLVDYVEHAEAAGWHEGRTCQARRVWFDLGELPVPDAFVPKLLRERVFTVRNRAGAVPSNAIDCLSVREGVDAALLLAVLDSSLCRALMEVWGRDEAGMLQLMTYETRTLPVPDVRTFSTSEAAAVRDAAAALGPTPSSDSAAQSALDAAVVDAIDVGLTAERLGVLRERLLRRRLDGGERVEVPLA